MQRDSDLQAPWIGFPDKYKEDRPPRVAFQCEWCGEAVYEGELSYNFDGERVCEDCVNSCRETSVARD